MKGIIERFEGDYVVIEFEGETMVDIHKGIFPLDLTREMPFNVPKGHMSSMN